VPDVPLRWPRRRLSVPDALARALDTDEHVQVLAPLVDGDLLAVTRFGLWLLSGDVAVRWNWETVSKARLAAGTLVLTAAQEVAVTDDGIVLLQDLPPREFRLAGPTGLTDAVHTRVRRSVGASRHLPWPGAGGWVVLRRIPGRNGLTTQVRLDGGISAAAAGQVPADFLAAVRQVAGELNGEAGAAG
jgi:hypothetical protein